MGTLHTAYRTQCKSASLLFPILPRLKCIENARRLFECWNIHNHAFTQVHLSPRAPCFCRPVLNTFCCHCAQYPGHRWFRLFLFR